MKNKFKFLSLTAIVATSLVLISAAPEKKAEEKAVVKVVKKDYTISSIGVVDFDKCVRESKIGKDEQKSLENMQIEFNKTIEPARKEWEELGKKLSDTEFKDSLSPQKEQELQEKKFGLEQELQMKSYQLNQMFQQAQMKMIMVTKDLSANAAENVAKKLNIPLVLESSSATLYSSLRLNITDDVIKEMDSLFDEAKKAKQKALPAPKDKEEPKK